MPLTGVLAEKVHPFEKSVRQSRRRLYQRIHHEPHLVWEGLDHSTTSPHRQPVLPDLNSQAGWSVSDVGDVNGDLVNDVLVGAPVRGGYRGSAYLYCATASSAVCDVQPGSLDFGTVPVGGQADLTFTITNVGTTTASGITLNGESHNGWPHYWNPDC